MRIIIFILFVINSFVLLSQENITHGNIILENVSYKIVKYHSNGQVAEIARFKIIGNYNYSDKYKELPDSLLDLSIKDGKSIKFKKNGKVKKEIYYKENVRKNRRFLGIKFGWWYEEKWRTYYIFNYPWRAIESCGPF